MSMYGHARRYGVHDDSSRGGASNSGAEARGVGADPFKVAAREHARARRVPVLMDANDRGLLDVERSTKSRTDPSSTAAEVS